MASSKQSVSEDVSTGGLSPPSGERPAKRTERGGVRRVGSPEEEAAEEEAGAPPGTSIATLAVSGSLPTGSGEGAMIL